MAAACSKRWVILFTCLATRAIHIEVVEDTSSSAFVNALRRFQAIRGKVTQYRSDRGSNFVGATGDLRIDTINVEDGPVQSFLYNSGVTWKFNPPHASHMGGTWERMIGVTRRILKSMMANMSARNLTHEVLTTFVCEVCAIVNNRPIVPVSTDPNSPFILSPNTLLTSKTGSTVEPLTDVSTKDLYKAQWKRVQTLAELFWKRWHQEYLHTLQERRKWQVPQPNVQKGDVILLKEKDVQRNQLPLGIVTEAIPGTDGHVRKAIVRVSREGKIASYTRPISEIVVLLRN